jgi:hypothetical protein
MHACMHSVCALHACMDGNACTYGWKRMHVCVSMHVTMHACTCMDESMRARMHHLFADQISSQLSALSSQFLGLSSQLRPLMHRDSRTRSFRGNNHKIALLLAMKRDPVRTGSVRRALEIFIQKPESPWQCTP